MALDRITHIMPDLPLDQTRSPSHANRRYIVSVPVMSGEVGVTLKMLVAEEEPQAVTMAKSRLRGCCAGRTCWKRDDRDTIGPRDRKDDDGHLCYDATCV
jgi:hypothetical protein